MWRVWFKRLGVFRSTLILTAVSILMSVMITSAIEVLVFGQIRPLLLVEATFAPFLIAPPIVFTILHLTLKLDEAE